MTHAALTAQQSGPLKEWMGRDPLTLLTRHSPLNRFHAPQTLNSASTHLVPVGATFAISQRHETTNHP